MHHRDLDESDVHIDARRMEDETWWWHMVVDRVKDEPDPAERARMAKDAMDVARRLVADLAEVRAEAVRRLHETEGSWRKAGARMGTTGQNAFKIAARARGHESL